MSIEKEKQREKTIYFMSFMDRNVSTKLRPVGGQFHNCSLNTANSAMIFPNLC
jgi:hypothetical protein